jgi:hypothetical protein
VKGEYRAKQFFVWQYIQHVLSVKFNVLGIAAEQVFDKIPHNLRNSANLRELTSLSINSTDEEIYLTYCNGLFMRHLKWLHAQIASTCLKYNVNGVGAFVSFPVAAAGT